MHEKRSLGGHEEASAAALANKSPRTKYLEELERWVEGTQYDELPDWFSEDVPLLERAPCIVYAITKNAIDSFGDLVLGESRWPQFQATIDEAETQDQAAGDTDSEASAEGAGAITEAHRQARFKAAARECLAHAMACRSAVAIFGVRNGKLFVDTTKAAWCEPELDADGRVTRLEIRYPYFVESKDAAGKWQVSAKLYRRVIDGARDVTYLPADAEKSGIEPKWKEDSERSVEHGFKFCPVIWYPFMKGCTTVAQKDGRALHEHLLDEIRALDMALSQRHRAALYAGDPQWTEVGVSPGYNPSSSGRHGGIPNTPSGGPPGTHNPVTGHFADVRPDSGGARRKGPGYVWQYEDPKAKAELHTLPPGALKALEDHARDLRTKISESLAVTFLDPESIRYAAALSGKALEVLRERQLNRCDQIRTDFGDKFLIPATLMLMQVVRAVSAREGVRLRFPRLKEALTATATLDAADLTLLWPPYFRPDLGDEQKESTIVRDDLEAGIITFRTAVQRRAARYGIDDIDAYVTELEEERAARDHSSSQLVKMLADGDDEKTSAKTAAKQAPPDVDADAEEES